MSGHLHPDIVCSYRQLPVTSVDDAAETDTSRTPIGHQSLHGRSHRTAGIENVIHQYNITVIQVNRYFSHLHFRHLELGPEIISVEGDIQHTKVRHQIGRASCRERAEVSEGGE